MKDTKRKLKEILFLSSFPPRACGIATFSQNLVQVIEKKFGQTYQINVCALETTNEKCTYEKSVVAQLNTDLASEFERISSLINNNKSIETVVIQHEFGFFAKQEKAFEQFLFYLNKPVLIVFHTVLPNPDPEFKKKVERIVSAVDEVVVMTNNSKEILNQYYDIQNRKISVIPHGTPLISNKNPLILKEKFGFQDRQILSTFGLLNKGKSIETTLDALPAIIEKHPDVLFLILGQTHPIVLENEGETYRDFLKKKVIDLNLENHVHFINHYLSLNELLDYLQLTDIYLFTSNDPNQAVSGTFSYAMSCGCPIISTPIPHALEVLKDDSGMLFDFNDSEHLGYFVNFLLSNPDTREKLSLNALQKMIPTTWYNVAIKYAHLIKKISKDSSVLNYDVPDINLEHLQRMTTDFGIIQFAKINQPDLESGYTVDDNARALIAIVMQQTINPDHSNLYLIDTYLNFIQFCQQEDGSFLNYVDIDKKFSSQNEATSLEDANGRAIWALGYLINNAKILPDQIVEKAKNVLESTFSFSHSISSPRSMAFIIKGIMYAGKDINSWQKAKNILIDFANRLCELYAQESEKNWRWFESYMTYANSVLPESLLCAYQVTGNLNYRNIAKESFDFLLNHTFNGNRLNIISNKGWLYKGEERGLYGEQPIDVVYTILALKKFYFEFRNEDYKVKMKIAFNWFLGENHLKQIIYNPKTGGCFDGLEEKQINLNQGAESTVSYLIARLTIDPIKKSEAYFNKTNTFSTQLKLKEGRKIKIIGNSLNPQ